MPKRNNDLVNITRFDQAPRAPGKAGQHGWWVRMQKNGEKYHQFFNDNKYGSKKKALEAAKQYRDAVKTQYIDPVSTNVSPHTKVSKRSESGIIGVSRTKYQYQKRGRTYEADAWQANWPLGNGKYSSRQFSVKKYGEEEAFALALKAREEGLEKANYPEGRAEYYPPENINQPIWRYLDFTKFISMLDTKSIFFPTASSFSDKFEGAYSQGNREIRELLAKSKHSPGITPEDMAKLKEEVGISCWHANEYESAAMWELYSKSSESVCIQTTYEKLSLCLGGVAEIGMVQYVDYVNDIIPEHDPYLAFFHKRKSFQHENELRAIVKQLDTEFIGKGCSIPIELSLLVERVYVAPESPPWFFELVERAMKKYGLDKPVIKSSLADDPVY